MQKDRNFHVYVIELDPEVWTDNRFRWRNHHHRPGLPCVYVGQTARSAEERFAQHRQGRKANRFVQRFGRRLIPELTGPVPEGTREAAEVREAAVAEELRRRGWAVWWG